MLGRDGCIGHDQRSSSRDWRRLSRITGYSGERLCIWVPPWLRDPLQLQGLQLARLQIQLPAPRTAQSLHATLLQAALPLGLALASLHPSAPLFAPCQTACPASCLPKRRQSARVHSPRECDAVKPMQCIMAWQVRTQNCSTAFSAMWTSGASQLMPRQRAMAGG